MTDQVDYFRQLATSDAPMRRFGRGTEVTDRIEAYRKGRIPFEELLGFLDRDWPDPRRFAEAVAYHREPNDVYENFADSVERNQDGTWDEVVRNYFAGNLSEEEWQAIQERVVVPRMTR